MVPLTVTHTELVSPADYSRTASTASGWRAEMGIEITEVRVSLRDDAKLKAFASITLADAFVIRGLKIIEGNKNRMFVAMPSRKRPDGKHQDIAHPITQEMRKYLEDKVIAEYEEEVARAKEGRMFVGSR